MHKITIAIDGYSSCGKSTLAKALAHRLHYSYIDTGAMYRAVTVYALQCNLINDTNELNIEGLISELPNVNVEFNFNQQTKASETILNGQNVDAEIRSKRVNDNVSKVSSIKAVRNKMVALQRQMGKKKAVVLDGRDIGTQVFPKAELKLFMIADPEVRAKRRQDEFSSKGQFYTLAEVEMSLLKRDMADISREEQLDYVLKLIEDMQVMI